MSSVPAVAVPRGLSALDAKLSALILPHAKAAERFFEFFTANIRNKNTRRATGRVADAL